MSGFIEGDNRQQATLFPERLDDYITDENPVRVVDVFIDSLDLRGLGFKTTAERTGRPGFHPSTMLKLYVYGYLNRVQSSRRLEREAQRNVELMWLMSRLAPDFKTIADFRKDNGDGIKAVCREFVLLCKKLGLLSSTCVAVDGSKFKAVNSDDRSFTPAKMERRLKKLDESIDKYLAEIKRIDNENTKEAENTKIKLKDRLAKVREEAQRLKLIEKKMLESPDQQIALTDPDARIMQSGGRSTVVTGYNVQSVVDTENHLIVTHEVTNRGSDRSQLFKMSRQAKKVLGLDTMDVVADKGYYKGTEILACANAGIATYLAKPQTSISQSKGKFGKRDFKYIEVDDEYQCPAGQRLTYRSQVFENGLALDRYWTSACEGCTLKAQCTTAPSRRISRWEHEHVLEELDKRMANEPERMITRRSTVEHPFGTIKTWMGHTHFQMKGISRVATEMSLHVLSYNMKRVVAMLGTVELVAAIRDIIKQSRLLFFRLTTSFSSLFEPLKFSCEEFWWLES